MRSRARATLAAAVLAAAVFIVSPAVAFANVTPWDANNCAQTQMNNPHIATSGNWGVLAKAQWQCNTTPATVHLDAYAMGYWLWVCPVQAQANENWITSNCTFKGSTL